MNYIPTLPVVGPELLLQEDLSAIKFAEHLLSARTLNFWIELVFIRTINAVELSRT